MILALVVAAESLRSAAGQSSSYKNSLVGLFLLCLRHDTMENPNTVIPGLRHYLVLT